MKIQDKFSEQYMDYLDGTYDSVDRIVLNAYFRLGQSPGKWTLPAGYLENGESVQEGAIRETREETLASVQIIEPYRLFNIVFVDQIYFMFRSNLTSDTFGPTNESTDVRLFDEKDIPWEDIAFKVIKQTLEHYFQDRKI